MTISVSEAARILEERGALGRRRKNQAEWVIDFVGELIGRPIPADLAEFYRENIEWVDAFRTTIPVWNDYVGRVTDDAAIDRLLAAKAVPIFWDGCGSLYGVDVSEASDHPAVYFFDHERGWDRPAYAAGSSIGSFLLLLADHDRALDEKRSPGWELAIDPDVDKCPRAPPIWLAD
jgi:hypothetical protein